MLDVLVIGGGQAGLVMGYHFAQRGFQSKILDANAKSGDAWRCRWDSLKLFTPDAGSHNRNVHLDSSFKRRAIGS